LPKPAPEAKAHSSVRRECPAEARRPGEPRSAETGRSKSSTADLAQREPFLVEIAAAACWPALRAERSSLLPAQALGSEAAGISPCTRREPTRARRRPSPSSSRNTQQISDV